MEGGPGEGPQEPGEGVVGVGADAVPAETLLHISRIITIII